MDLGELLMYFKHGRFLSTKQTQWKSYLMLCLLLLGMTSTFTAAHTAEAASASNAPTASDIANGKPALGNAWQAPKLTGDTAKAGSAVSGQVLLQLASGTTITNGSKATTSSTALNSALNSLHATSLTSLGNGLVLAKINPTADPTAAANQLASVQGVTEAEPNRYVSTMNTPATPLPTSIINTANKQASSTLQMQRTQQTTGTTLPSNYGLTSSLESWLNAGGVDAMGAYQEIESRYGQLPGTGEIITNVSVGDLTDQSMAAAGDTYVQAYGPTTIIQNGQRYLDLPSMPLIPTWTADATGQLNPTGSTENEDPTDGEIMLDFGVMAPLPHNLQRPDATGSGMTDLLGIAPGASYRLVVPSQPTTDQIAAALLAAAKQTPRPNVINASLGFGTDANGFPSRYLEDDPLLESTIATIVHQYGITVSISSNDGTRLYTPTSVGPDGGSTPTNVTNSKANVTNINDDANSTTPSEVLDSGAIAAGGTTTDDTLASGTTGPATVAETRISGGGNFSSGFGSRIDLSAPSDNIIAFEHPVSSTSTPQSVSVVLTGGTSAAAPEIAAAAAVVDQVGRLTGHNLTPAQIRSLLESTGRKVTTAEQIDQTLHVGPQLDLTAAVNALLPPTTGNQNPQLIRLSIAHHETIGGLGGTFLENTDPSNIDLTGPNNTGEGLAGPITFAADLTGSQPGDSYQLVVGSTHFRSSIPSIRVTPTQLLTAAGLPVVSTSSRNVTVTFDVLHGGRTVTSATRTLTLSASNGTIVEAQAPTVNPVANTGQNVTVHYNLSNVRNISSPVLVVSTVGHWNPTLAPEFNVAWSTPLTATSGTVTIPASAFASGGGIYGIGFIQNDSSPSYPVYGEFAPIRIAGFNANDRPAAPTLATQGQVQGHQISVSNADPSFTLHYSVKDIPGVYGAMLEISAPAPTVFNSLNTFTNQNGTARDNDGYDSGSVVYQSLGGTAGTVQLNAIKLGLENSLQYNVRILPVDSAGQAVGQASPSSALLFNGGLVPNNGTVLDFSASGQDSIAAVTNGSGTGASVYHYNPTTGSYGSLVTSDATATAEYAVIGVDTSLHRALIVHWTNSSSKQLETWDLTTNTEVGKPVTLLSSQYTFIGGRVDQTRHRAALLVWAQPGNADELLPFDMTTGTLGTAIPLDTVGNTSAGYYNIIDLDQATGHVEVAHLNKSLICFGSNTSVVLDVNLDTSTAAASTSPLTRCGVAFADDQQGGNGWLISHTSFSANTPGNFTLQSINEQTFANDQSYTMRQQAPLTMAIDSVHHLAVVAYMAPYAPSVWGGLPKYSDSNSMSQLDVIDLNTGAVLRTISLFNFTAGLTGSLNTISERGIQLDPSTLTGWTFGPGETQIQSFQY
jgi:hypothetical protein